MRDLELEVRSRRRHGPGAPSCGDQSLLTRLLAIWLEVISVLRLVVNTQPRVQASSAIEIVPVDMAEVDKRLRFG